MSPDRARNLVLLSLVITMGMGFINSFLVKRNTPRIRLFIGAMIVFILLSAMAEFSPELAGGFAILVLVSAFLLEGGGVLNFLVGRGTHDHIGNTTTGTPTPSTPKGGQGVNIPGVGHIKLPSPPTFFIPKKIPFTNIPDPIYWGSLAWVPPAVFNNIPALGGLGAPSHGGVQPPGRGFIDPFNQGK